MAIRAHTLARALAGALVCGPCLLTAAPPALAGCTLVKLAELPVTMVGPRPIVDARLNGVEAPLIADSGSTFSMLSAASAAQLHLPLQPAPYNLMVGGIGGASNVSIGTARTFELAGAVLKNVQFLVGGGAPGSGAAGVLGQNVLHIADVEYDLAHGVIRLMRPRGCGAAPLAYWAGGQPLSELDIEPGTPEFPLTVGSARLNGARIRVMFDTGSPMSMLTLHAAARAGLRPGGPGVVSSGYIAGVGRQLVRIWLAPVDSFQIGGEQIRHTRLRFGDIDVADVDMLLGTDFFLSHRLYVANGQHRVYFTYNGGPVFSLPPAVPVGAQAFAPESGAQTSADAAALARQGMALAARHEFAPAISALTQACGRSPQQPRYWYERALVYQQAGQVSPALADLTHALRLQPGYVDALLARAALDLSPHRGAALADLQAADRLLAPSADQRLLMADDYLRAGLPAPALADYHAWIDAHRQDARFAHALAGRCRARAQLQRLRNPGLQLRCPDD